MHPSIDFQRSRRRVRQAPLEVKLLPWNKQPNTPVGFDTSSEWLEFQLLNLHFSIGIISRFCVARLRCSQPWRINQIQLPFTLWVRYVHDMSVERHTSIHTSMLPTLWRSHLLGSSNGSLCRCCNTASAPQQQLSLAFFKCMFIWIDRFYSVPRETLGCFAWHTRLVFVSGQLKIYLLHFVCIIFEEPTMSWSFLLYIFILRFSWPCPILTTHLIYNL